MRQLLRERAGIVIAVAVVLLFLSANRFATFLTDLWWFDDLGGREVFIGILLTRVGLGVAFGLALAALIAVNLVVARRMRPLVVPASEREAIIERYRQMSDPYVPWIIAAVAGLFALSAGGAVATQWDRFLLWRHGGEFGTVDPQFGRDIGYYVFELPFYSFLQGWLFTSLLLTLLVTAGAHYLLGSIRPELPRDRVTPRAKAHLSVLLALTLGAHAWGYWLGRYHLNFSPRGTVTGASYTDVNAELPALYLLIGVTVVAVLLVLWNIRSRGWLLPGAAVVLLVVASVILQGIYPSAIQRLRVDPQELDREHEFIGHNMELTREAYGIGDTERQRFPVRNDLSPTQVEDEQVTIQNVRLWDPAVLETTYAELQALRTYYRFEDVDVDRYEIDGESRQVMLSTRELELDRLPPEAQTWQNLRLTYTHGLGVVASQVNTANPEGQPVFLARDIPPQGTEELVPDERPGIYFGERGNPSYSIVATEQPELHFEGGEEEGAARTTTTRYEGATGVGVGSYLRRLMFAIRFGDPNFVLSGLIQEDSKVLFARDIRDRVRRVAPYLELDRDPYPVVLDGRILWIQDAYTTSDHYPYSQRLSFADFGVMNYIRNSVKAVVDAYDGTVHLYLIEQDPIIEAWRQIFPDLYRDLDEAPEGLIEHFRYPQDMFQAQAEIYRTYHIPNVEDFYSKSDAWDIPAAPATGTPAAGDQRAARMRPYYLLMRLPGEQTEEFVLIQPYLARERPNMIAWLAGRADGDNYGELYAVQFPSDQTILGPQQAQARIEQNDDIAEYITLRDQAGSRVIRGNLLVIPVGQSILYVQPLFLESPQARIPQLERVVAVMGERVAFERNLDDAIRSLVGLDPEEPTDGVEDPDEPGQILDIDEIVLRALEHLAEADQALRDGNLAAYQRNIQQAERLLEQAAADRGVAPETDEDADEPSDGEDEPPPEEA